jgi:hypothetical protein
MFRELNGSSFVKSQAHRVSGKQFDDQGSCGLYILQTIAFTLLITLRVLNIVKQIHHAFFGFVCREGVSP